MIERRERVADRLRVFERSACGEVVRDGGFEEIFSFLFERSELGGGGLIAEDDANACLLHFGRDASARTSLEILCMSVELC